MERKLEVTWHVMSFSVASLSILWFYLTTSFFQVSCSLDQMDLSKECQDCMCIVFSVFFCGIIDLKFLILTNPLHSLMHFSSGCVILLQPQLNLSIKIAYIL